MTIAVSVFFTWVVIIILALIPKTLSDREMIFLFFVDTMIELSAFTLIYLNFHWIVVSRTVEKSLAYFVIRLVMIPVVLLIASNVMLYSSRFYRWAIVPAVAVSGVLIQFMLQWLGVLTTIHWSAAGTALLFVGYALAARVMMWFIMRLARGEPKVA